MVRNYSSIQVSNETKSRLKLLRLTPNESFENIILRILDTKLGSREIQYLIKNNKGNCEIKCVVDWGKETENIQFFDMSDIRKFRVPMYRFNDREQQNDWDNFREDITNLNNLINILAILEYGEVINAGELVLKRIS